MLGVSDSLHPNVKPADSIALAERMRLGAFPGGSLAVLGMAHMPLLLSETGTGPRSTGVYSWGSKGPLAEREPSGFGARRDELLREVGRP